MAEEKKKEDKELVPVEEILESGSIVVLPSQDGKFERIISQVKIPKDVMYNVPRWNSETRRKEACWRLDSTAYDLINRAMGVQFHQPDTVVDEVGNEVGNPIQRKDYIKLRMTGFWYNSAGLPVQYTEDVEINFWVLFTQKLMESDSSAIVTKNEPNSVCIDKENDIYIKVNPADYKKAWAFLISKRAFATRYAYTVAKRRIMKTATGIGIVHPRKVGGHEMSVIPVISFKNVVDSNIQRHAKKISGKMFKDTEAIDTEVRGVEEQIPSGAKEDRVLSAKTEDRATDKSLDEQIEEVFKASSRADKIKLMRQLMLELKYSESNLVKSIDMMDDSSLLGIYQMLLKKKPKKETK